ncbi:tetratricopeptide repeat protein [Caldilinea sp.]|uniref:tetratricopeptide repeat protein n=1 Tax=Caldilinea sp. TaxID=2293560 RepID=UPI002C513F59|nr:hypothetical protein [Caldilinea sp.]HRA67649.1 hypothetical protein [Caldilinea sp.]
MNGDKRREAKDKDTAQGDYPAIFRLYIMRSITDVLRALDTSTYRMNEAIRERSLHLLSFGLGLAESWLVTQELMALLASRMESAGYRHEWIAVLERGIEVAKTYHDQPVLARLHLRLGRLYDLMNMRAEAKRHLEISYQISSAQGDSELIATSLQRLAFVSLLETNLPQAKRLSNEALELLDEEAPQRADSHLVLGWVALRNNETQIAEDHFGTAFRLRWREGKAIYIAQTLREIGSGHIFVQQWRQAIAHLDQAVNLFDQEGDALQAAICKMHRGVAYSAIGKHEKSLEDYNGVLQVFQSVSDVAGLIDLYNNRGNVLAEMMRYDDARNSLCTSIGIAADARNYWQVANGFESLASLYLRTGDFNAAISALDEAERALDLLPTRPQQLATLIETRRQETLMLIAQKEGTTAG